ncbi:MAG: acetyltransferase [Paludibacter sp.]
MKWLYKIILKGINLLTRILFSRKFVNWLNNKFNYIYTNWILNQFEKIGLEVKISYPIYLHGGERIKVGNNFRCDQRLRLEAISIFHDNIYTPQIIIGDNVCIQKDCHIAAINKIEIGNNVLIASKVYIGDHSHGEISMVDLILPPGSRKLYSKGAVIIKDNVWLGEGVIILPGVFIGENCIIGAGAVVTKDCNANSIYGGNPAKLIKTIN